MLAPVQFRLRMCGEGGRKKTTNTEEEIEIMCVYNDMIGFGNAAPLGVM